MKTIPTSFFPPKPTVCTVITRVEVGFHLKSPICEFCSRSRNISLCEESEVLPRLLLDCTEIIEASFLQMGKITDRQKDRQNELSDT